MDIATLTGAMMRALGREVAGVIGNHERAGGRGALRPGDATGEPVWPLPLHWRLSRRSCRSTVADMKNLG